MPFKDPEKRKEYKRQYYLDNKDHFKEQQKEYSQTPEGLKKNRIYDWKRSGVIHNNFDELYSLYIATTECMVCHATFKNSKDRCLDHSHITGEYRNVLCRACNVMDNWAKRA